MQNHDMSVRNAVCLLTTLAVSSMQMSGIGLVGQDMWLAIIASVITLAPFIWLFSKIGKANPGLGLFDIVKLRFSRVTGSVIIILMSWYALHIASLVSRNFTEFISFISLSRTPRMFLVMGLVLVGCYLATCDMWTIGRWSMVVLASVAVLFVATFLMSLRIIKLDNIMPIMEHSLPEIFVNGYSLGTIAFGETVLLLVCAGKIDKKSSIGRVYKWGIALAAVLMLLLILRDILVLGKDMSRVSVFPSYITARIISPGKFLEHMESIVSYYTMLFGITKIGFCINVAAKGMAHIAGDEKKEKLFIIPAGLISTAVCAMNFTNFAELLEFVKIYRVYTLLFIALIPTMVLIKSEYQNFRDKRKASAAGE